MILRPCPKPDAALRLIVFPYSRGWHAPFQTWPDYFAADSIEVCLVELPHCAAPEGKVSPDDLRDIAHSAAAAMCAYTDKPYAIFGHGLGSLSARDVLRQIRRQNDRMPEEFIVAVHSAPAALQSGEQTLSHLEHLSLQEFFDLARELGGTEGAVLSDPSTEALIIPTLKSDYYAYASYDYAEEEPFHFPITAFYSEADPVVREDTISQWKQETDSAFEIHSIEGDALFVISGNEQFKSQLRTKLQSILARTGGAN